MDSTTITEDTSYRSPMKDVLLDRTAHQTPVTRNIYEEKELNDELASKVGDKISSDRSVILKKYTELFNRFTESVGGPLSKASGNVINSVSPSVSGPLLNKFQELTGIDIPGKFTGAITGAFGKISEKLGASFDKSTLGGKKEELGERENLSVGVITAEKIEVNSEGVVEESGLPLPTGRNIYEEKELNDELATKVGETIESDRSVMVEKYSDLFERFTTSVGGVLSKTTENIGNSVSQSLGGPLLGKFKELTGIDLLEKAGDLTSWGFRKIDEKLGKVFQKKTTTIEKEDTSEGGVEEPFKEGREDTSGFPEDINREGNALGGAIFGAKKPAASPESGVSEGRKESPLVQESLKNSLKDTKNLEEINKVLQKQWSLDVKQDKDKLLEIKDDEEDKKTDFGSMFKNGLIEAGIIAAGGALVFAGVQMVEGIANAIDAEDKKNKAQELTKKLEMNLKEAEARLEFFPEEKARYEEEQSMLRAKEKEVRDKEALDKSMEGLHWKPLTKEEKEAAKVERMESFSKPASMERAQQYMSPQKDAFISKEGKVVPISEDDNILVRKNMENVESFREKLNKENDISKLLSDSIFNREKEGAIQDNLKVTSTWISEMARRLSEQETIKEKPEVKVVPQSNTTMNMETSFMSMGFSTGSAKVSAQ